MSYPSKTLPLPAKSGGPRGKAPKMRFCVKLLLKAKKASKMRPGDANEAVKKHDKSCPKSLFFLSFSKVS